MGNLHLVTGYAGEPHVAAADQGSLFEALIRNGQFVMEAGANFSATAVTNNQIRVSDGELLMQGRHVKMNPGTYVDIAIENGTPGYLRNDLIVARYTKSVETGIEECSLVVLKGTQAESNPSDPKYTTGNINADGARQHDFPLYRVPLSGLNVGNPVALFKPQKSLFEVMLLLTGGTMTGDIAMSGYKVTGLGTPTANGDAVPLGFAQQKFAPSGYGLGTSCVARAQADNIRENCYFYFIPGSGNISGVGADVSQDHWFGEHIEYSLYKRAYQRITYGNSVYRGCFAIRSRVVDTWSEWEWVNPPLIAGIEYRTTERYQGAVVYKKVNTNGDVLWRTEGSSRWRLLASASYVTEATVE